ncbi:MAG: PepSY domain-containing protein [Thermodesulfobacteriota bacterium]
MKQIVSLILFVSFLSFPIAASGSEDDYYYSKDELEQAPREEIITINEAINKAVEVVPGEVIKAEFKHGRYEIKVFSDNGWVTKVHIDPVDGSIIKPPFYKKMKRR